MLSQVGKTVRQRSVPGEKNAPPISLQEITVVTAMSVALLPRAPVFYLKSTDSNVSRKSFERLPFTPTKLRDVTEIASSEADRLCAAR